MDAHVTRTVGEPTEKADEAGSALTRLRIRRLPPQPLVLLACLGLALWMFAPAWSSPTDTTLRGGGGDPAIFIFFLRWVPFALEHGRDLLVTHHLNYPDGVNLMWNTSLPLPGLLFAPVTLIWGPVLTFNVLLVLAYSLSSWCAYLAIRRFVPGHLAPAVGGLVYGFSPAIRSQGSHLHMSLAFLVPLMLLALHEILVRQRRSPWLAGAALGLLAGCQLLIGEELLAMTTLLGFAMCLLLVLGNLRRVRSRVSHTLKAFGVALVVFAAVAAWPLTVQFTGAQRIHGDVNENIPRHTNDLYGFVVPNPQPKVVGGRDTGVWLPWAFLQSLPLLDSMIPNRLAVLTALFAGLLVALFLHAVWRRDGWWRVVAVAVGLAVLAALWPARSVPAQKVGTPAFFTGAAVRTLPRDGVSLVVPFPYRGSAAPMTWQAEADMWFHMPGGYFIGPQPNGRPRFDAPPTSTSLTLPRILNGRPPPKLTGPRRRALARDFVRWRVSSVIVGPMPNQATMVSFLTDLLGREPEQVAGVYLWRNPVVRLTDPTRRARPETKPAK